MPRGTHGTRNTKYQNNLAQLQKDNVMLGRALLLICHDPNPMKHSENLSIGIGVLRVVFGEDYLDKFHKAELAAKAAVEEEA